MTITEDRQPTTCPAWCVQHERVEDGTPEDRALVHRAALREVARYELRVHRLDWDDDEPPWTEIMLDDTLLSAANARALGEALIAAADAVGGGARIT
ncbi:hypothetical protein [Blastococcus saxobsidens]|uniref:Uncharacterized protein n=1 Tax=Blastococcus saxobsidens TaxID=138336 RepID=A0A4Q7Y6P9_9ACTN|nr:hypothetical protein [Blastococcus saxobsidens]RZU32697.1 hypothetical protein BKA19_2398 [Blastococcus saxobsidens]